jgi:hypothetical protein
MFCPSASGSEGGDQPSEFVQRPPAHRKQRGDDGRGRQPTQPPCISPHERRRADPQARKRRQRSAGRAVVVPGQVREPSPHHEAALMVAELSRRDTRAEQRGEDSAGRGADDVVAGPRVDAGRPLQRTQRTDRPRRAEHAAGAEHESAPGLRRLRHDFSVPSSGRPNAVTRCGGFTSSPTTRRRPISR